MTEKFFLLALFLASLVLWSALNGRPGRYDFRSRLDAYVPFVPYFVFPYLAAYFFIPLAGAFLFFSSLGEDYFLTMVLAMYSAAIAWFLFPAKSFRPELVIAGRTIRNLVVRVSDGNPHGNAFPSTHVMTSIITAFYLSLLYPPGVVLFYAAALLIVFSTLLIKQHHLIDVTAGVLWAIAAIAVVQYGASII